VNNLSQAALDSAAVGIEPVISNRKSNVLTTTPPSCVPSLHQSIILSSESIPLVMKKRVFIVPKSHATWFR